MGGAFGLINALGGVGIPDSLASQAAEAPTPVYDAVSTLWVLLAAILVFFMQAGFGMVETGLIRAKSLCEKLASPTPSRPA